MGESSYPDDIGELSILESEETDESGAKPEGSLAAFDVDVAADFAERPVKGEFDIDVMQGSGAEVSEDGTIVADMVTVTMDEDNGFAVIEEVVGVLTPDGTQITEDRVSVLDPDGNLTVMADEVEVTEEDR